MAGWIAPVALGAASLIGGYFANRAQRKAQEEALAAQEEESEENRLFTEQQHLRQTALAESMADPWRHSMNQMGAMGRMDMIANYEPTRITVPEKLRGYAPEMSGGYEMSPELRAWAASGRNQIAAGGGRAPTMTNPANYGRTGGFDYTGEGGPSELSAGPGVGTENLALGTGAGEPTNPFEDEDYFEGINRRNEGAGGVLKGAATGALYGAAGYGVGAVPAAIIGGVVGAFTKNAKTAMTDVSIADARTIVASMYQRELGRPASPQEVDAQLGAIGWKPGHQWVGEGGLMAILEAMRRGPEAQGQSANA